MAETLPGTVTANVDKVKASWGNTMRTAVSNIDGRLEIVETSVSNIDGRLEIVETSNPAGYLQNGKLSVSVSSGSLTVALKTLADGDPGSSDPVRVRIGDVEHTLTSALSVTAAAGTNWCDAGGAELATKAVGYFAYLGYNATDGVVIGFSRIPYPNQYSDFSATSTNEKFCKISDISNASASDVYTVVGYFEATLSAGAGYTWTSPTNVISRPIYETSVLSWTPTWSGVASMTFTSVSTSHASYKVSGRTCHIQVQGIGTIGGTPSHTVYATCPFDALNYASQPAMTAWVIPDTSAEASFAYMDNTTNGRIAFRRTASSNWVAGANKYANGNGAYFIS